MTTFGRNPRGVASSSRTSSNAPIAPPKPIVLPSLRSLATPEELEAKRKAEEAEVARRKAVEEQKALEEQLRSMTLDSQTNWLDDQDEMDFSQDPFSGEESIQSALLFSAKNFNSNLAFSTSSERPVPSSFNLNALSSTDPNHKALGSINNSKSYNISNEPKPSGNIVASVWGKGNGAMANKHAFINLFPEKSQASGGPSKHLSIMPTTVLDNKTSSVIHSIDSDQKSIKSPVNQPFVQDQKPFMTSFRPPLNNAKLPNDSQSRIERLTREYSEKNQKPFSNRDYQPNHRMSSLSSQSQAFYTSTFSKQPNSEKDSETFDHNTNRSSNYPSDRGPSKLLNDEHSMFNDRNQQFIIKSRDSDIFSSPQFNLNYSSDSVSNSNSHQFSKVNRAHNFSIKRNPFDHSKLQSKGNIVSIHSGNRTGISNDPDPSPKNSFFENTDQSSIRESAILAQSHGKRAQTSIHDSHCHEKDKHADTHFSPCNSDMNVMRPESAPSILKIDNSNTRQKRDALHPPTTSTTFNKTPTAPHSSIALNVKNYGAIQKKSLKLTLPHDSNSSSLNFNANQKFSNNSTSKVLYNSSPKDKSEQLGIGIMSIKSLNPIESNDKNIDIGRESVIPVDLNSVPDTLSTLDGQGSNAAHKDICISSDLLHAIKSQSNLDTISSKPITHGLEDDKMLKTGKSAENKSLHRSFAHQKSLINKPISNTDIQNDLNCNIRAVGLTHISPLSVDNLKSQFPSKSADKAGKGRLTFQSKSKHHENNSHDSTHNGIKTDIDSTSNIKFLKPTLFPHSKQTAFDNFQVKVAADLQKIDKVSTFSPLTVSQQPSKDSKNVKKDHAHSANTKSVLKERQNITQETGASSGRPSSPPGLTNAAANSAQTSTKKIVVHLDRDSSLTGNVISVRMQKRQHFRSRSSAANIKE